MGHAGHHHTGPEGISLGADPLLTLVAALVAGVVVILVVARVGGRLRWPVQAVLGLALVFHSHLDHALGVDHSPPPVCCLLVQATLTTPSPPPPRPQLWGLIASVDHERPARDSFKLPAPIRSPPVAVA